MEPKPRTPRKPEPPFKPGDIVAYEPPNVSQLMQRHVNARQDGVVQWCRLSHIGVGPATWVVSVMWPAYNDGHGRRQHHPWAAPKHRYSRYHAGNLRLIQPIDNEACPPGTACYRPREKPLSSYAEECVEEPPPLGTWADAKEPPVEEPHNEDPSTVECPQCHWPNFNRPWPTTCGHCLQDFPSPETWLAWQEYVAENPMIHLKYSLWLARRTGRSVNMAMAGRTVERAEDV